MKKKIFRLNLKKMAIFMLITALMAILAIGGHSIINVFNISVDNVELNMLSHLKSADFILSEKTNNIQRFVDSLNSNEELHALLKDEEPKNAEIDAILKKQIVGFDDIEGCVMVNSQGRGYAYNLATLTEANLLQLQVSCPRLSDKKGELKWYNVDLTEQIAPAFNNFVICGTKLFDKEPVTLYLFIRNDIFSSIFNISPKNTVLTVLNNEGELIISNNKAIFTSLFYDETQNLIWLYEAEEGVFEIKEGGSDNICGYHQSVFNGFKFLEIYPENIFYDECYDTLIFIIFVIILFILIVVAIYLMLIKRFIVPIRQLSDSMQKFDADSLYTQIPVHGDDEVGMLSSCFNSMTKRIEMIIEDVKRKEEEKKQAELLSLKSQIKPHFIYNTLNVIKIMAMYSKQTNIADAIHNLTRLLRRAFASDGTFVVLSEDIEFINDYIAVLQICYKNMIDFSYHIDEQVQNAEIPIMIIQPIVENAITHGLADKLVEKKDRAKIYIDACKSGERLIIEVTDNGEGMTKEQISDVYSGITKNFGSGVGLRSIIERIRLLYGDEYGITIESKETHYTTIRIELPLQ